MRLLCGYIEATPCNHVCGEECTPPEEPQPVGGLITAFGQLEEDIRWQNGDTPYLPAAVAGEIEGQPAQIPVSWAAEGYSIGGENAGGLYVFFATPNQGYTTAGGVEDLRITYYYQPQPSCFGTFAISFNPLQIYNAHQLADVATLVNKGRLESFINQAVANIKLMNDIDLSAYGANWNGGKGWIPIGWYDLDNDTTYAFNGHFDGDNHVITGLFIDSSGNVILGSNTQVNLPGGKTVDAPKGSTITGDGKLIVGSGGATISSGRITLHIPAGAEIIFDEDVPLGYFVPAANPFIDVSSTDWFYDNVMFNYTHGLMNGTGNNRFSPNDTLTRAMFITILARLTGVDTEGGETWYSKAVEWAIAEGITDGENLHNPITREQIAAMLQRYAQLPIPAEPALFADDADISSYAREAVSAMQSAGVIGGKPGNIIDPHGHATRAEAAAMLHRLVKALDK